MDGEENKPVATDAIAPAASGDGAGAGATDAGAGGAKPEATATEAKSDQGTAENAKADSSKDDLAPAVPAEPVVRQWKSNKDFIIERKEAKIRKLSEAKAAERQDNGGYDAGDDESDDDDGADIEEKISRAVDQRLSPLIERQQEEEDSREAENVMREFPELADLTPKLKEWMKHPSRQKIPARSILYELAGDRLMKIGAERERKAAEQARQTQTGGGTQRNDGGDKKPENMTDAEFADHIERIKNGR